VVIPFVNACFCSYDGKFLLQFVEVQRQMASQSLLGVADLNLANKSVEMACAFLRAVMSDESMCCVLYICDRIEKIAFIMMNICIV
jgi:hypothetical protein